MASFLSLTVAGDSVELWRQSAFSAGILAKDVINFLASFGVSQTCSIGVIKNRVAALEKPDVFTSKQRLHNEEGSRWQQLWRLVVGSGSRDSWMLPAQNSRRPIETYRSKAVDRANVKTPFRTMKFDHRQCVPTLPRFIDRIDLPPAGIFHFFFIKKWTALSRERASSKAVTMAMSIEIIEFTGSRNIRRIA